MKNVTLSVWSLILALALVPAAQAQSAVADQIR